MPRPRGQTFLTDEAEADEDAKCNGSDTHNHTRDSRAHGRRTFERIRLQRVAIGISEHVTAVLNALRRNGVLAQEQCDYANGDE